MRLRDLLALMGPSDGPLTETLTIKSDGAEGGGGESGAGAEPEAETADGAGEPEAEVETADGDEEPEPKAAKGKEETPAQRRARLAKDADVQAFVKAQLRAATQKAVREALAAEQAETKRKAELAAKTTEERLAAEKLEAESKATKEAERAAKAEMELAFYRHMINSGMRLTDPEDMAFVQQAAAKLMEAEDLDLEAALTKVAKAKPHWFIASDEEQAKARAAKKAEAAKKATTTAEPKGQGSERRAEQKQTKAVRDMTPAEFEKYRRETHGIRTH